MKAEEASPEVKSALEWVESIRNHDEFGFSPNEKKLIALADEVYRLRKLLKAAARVKR